MFTVYSLQFVVYRSRHGKGWDSSCDKQIFAPVMYGAHFIIFKPKFKHIKTMKTDLEFRGVIAAELVARLQTLGVAFTTFERNEGMSHHTFQNI